MKQMKLKMGHLMKRPTLRGSSAFKIFQKSSSFKMGDTWKKFFRIKINSFSWSMIIVANFICNAVKTTRRDQYGGFVTWRRIRRIYYSLVFSYAATYVAHTLTRVRHTTWLSDATNSEKKIVRLADFSLNIFSSYIHWQLQIWGKNFFPRKNLFHKSHWMKTLKRKLINYCFLS